MFFIKIASLKFDQVLVKIPEKLRSEDVLPRSKHHCPPRSVGLAGQIAQVFLLPCCLAQRPTIATCFKAACYFTQWLFRAWTKKVLNFFTNCVAQQVHISYYMATSAAEGAMALHHFCRFIQLFKFPKTSNDWIVWVQRLDCVVLECWLKDCQVVWDLEKKCVSDITQRWNIVHCCAV